MIYHLQEFYDENGNIICGDSIEDICKLLNVQLNEYGAVSVLPNELLMEIEYNRNYLAHSMASKMYWGIIISYNSRQSLHYVLEEFMFI